MTRRDADEMFDLLGNELAREILVRTDERSRSATELANRCDVSKPTVYRRLDELERHKLVEKQTCYDADGNHYATYDCRVDEVTFGVGDGELAVELDLQSTEGGSDGAEDENGGGESEGNDGRERT